MQTVLILFLTLALIYCSQKVFAFLRALRSIQCVEELFRKRTFTENKSLIRNIPGYRVLLSPTSSLGYILPRIPAVCAGNNHFFEEKHTRKSTVTYTGELQH
jgi:hypothetical protein